ncbi:uncharacterized protein BcabD6B2_44380 [Babesia caballi]|uniref:Uncharacterized protein n=1 Tax=Babesia caballi TaxID=5871 RepID=A0AAV4LYA7_BABCB|nr:hypothetical protein BcabD6B2_44380 [Babesia caballi]
MGYLLLLHQALALLERVVELGVGVDELAPADEQLEPLAQVRAAAVPLGEGAHALRVVHDESGAVADAVLDVVAHELVQQLGGRGRLGHLEAGFLDGLAVVVVGVRPVELAARELGVVGHVDAFVAEALADLKHLLEAADDDHLERELGGHAQKEVNVEVIVVGNEGAGGGAAALNVQGRRLDLNEVPAGEEPPREGDDPRTHVHHLERFLVHDEVQVALAEPDLGVLEPGLVRKHVQAGGQQLDFPREHAQFTSLGTSCCGM